MLWPTTGIRDPLTAKASLIKPPHRPAMTHGDSPARLWVAGVIPTDNLEQRTSALGAIRDQLFSR
jgi:hypothetical protein